MAIELPEEIKEKISQKSEELGRNGLRRTSKDKLHITLKFIKEVNEQETQRICKQLEQIKRTRFSLRIAGFGAFPDTKRVRVIWIGLENNNELQTLVQDIENSIVEKESQKEEKFVPHITIARTRTNQQNKKIMEFLNKNKNEFFGEFEVKEFVLMESIPRIDRYEYREIQKFQLR